jgi:hypothetical protein
MVGWKDMLYNYECKREGIHNTHTHTANQWKDFNFVTICQKLCSIPAVPVERVLVGEVTLEKKSQQTHYQDDTSKSVYENSGAI